MQTRRGAAAPLLLQNPFIKSEIKKYRLPRELFARGLTSLLGSCQFFAHWLMSVTSKARLAALFFFGADQQSGRQTRRKKQMPYLALRSTRLPQLLYHVQWMLICLSGACICSAATHFWRIT